MKYTLPRFFTRLLTVLPPALLFAVKLDLPHVPVIALLLLLSGFFFRRMPASGGRASYYMFILVALLTLLPDFIVQPDARRMTAGDVFFRIQYLLPLLIYATASILLFRPAARVVSLACACAVLAMMLASDFTVVNMFRNTRFAGTGYLLAHYFLFYLASIAVQGAGCLLLLTENQRSGTDLPPARNFRTPARIRNFAMFLVPATAFLIGWLYMLNEAAIRKWENGIYRERRYRSIRRQMRMATSESDISRPFRNDPEFSNAVLFFAESASAPGYLRGNAFTLYRRGVWRNPARDERELPSYDPPDPVLNFNCFDLTERPTDYRRAENPPLTPSPERSVTVFPVELFPFRVLALPGNTTEVDAGAEKANLSPDGVLSLVNWKESGGYTAHVPEIRAESAPNRPRMPVNLDAVPREYLQIPEAMRTPLDYLLKLAEPEMRGSSAAEIAEGVARYLQKGYRYSLEPDEKNMPDGEVRHHDPALRFLFVTRNGHCELFATACVLMLRRAGIPARYVTGFLCARPLDENIWFSTGADAHAWVEYWSGDEQCWRMIDPTPAGENTVPPGGWERFRKELSYYFQSLSANVSRGYPARRAAAAMLFIYDQTTELAANPYTGLAAIFLLALLLAFLRWRRLRLARRFRLGQNAQIAMRRFRKELRRTERRTGIVKRECETLREWAARLPNKDGIRADALARIAVYEAVRFKPE